MDVNISFDKPAPRLRRLCLVLGDQLWLANPVLEALDPAQDAVLMIEAHSEGAAVWSHKARIVLFLSAMRHFREALQEAGLPVHYQALDTHHGSFQEQLTYVLGDLQPQELWLCEPGEWRMLALIQNAASDTETPIVVLSDTHFMCSREDFGHWARGRKELRMEYFYRDMRRRHGVLMQGTGKTAEPLGGQWNFDADNRQSFGKAGPGQVPEPARFEPDAITLEVMQQVQQRFAVHPGELASFAWPVTRTQALHALQQFVSTRLADFGPYQDAMWTDMTWGWHSLLSVALNLHLLDPREVIAAAEAAHHQQGLPLSSVEGFIRQVLGWREFVRGVYWLDMPRLQQANHFDHHRALPAWYWTGQTRMACMRHVIQQTLQHGYAHHIQRLMVTGQFALLAEIEPQAVCDWYLAMYVDAVDWVERPNTAGMALFATGPRLTSKPYVASGQYIRRMSNYCQGCAYQPEQRTGPQACPMTTLYWYFLDQHEQELARNPRTALMVRNLARLDEDERTAVRAHATHLLTHLDNI
ncbi:MAG: hypothetical protein RLZZ591_1723 [Pseudomonadota bacterium]|jgi:deoxyribodipyrimidine photolyase-related protein